MDQLDFGAGKSPRRELQGPRPLPLKVRKGSHKIKKPQLAPPQSPHHHRRRHYRPPVIIYTVSPKAIHTHPSEFMTLVQRLTGSTCPSSSTASAKYPLSSNISMSQRTSDRAMWLESSKTQISTCGSVESSGTQIWRYDPDYALEHKDINHWKQRISCPIAISPTARFVSTEKTNKSPEIKGMVESTEARTELLGRTFFTGILSPGPAALQTMPPNIFSPPSDQNLLSFFQDLSPLLQGNKNYMEGSFMPSPSYFLSPHAIASPTPSLDLFNNFFNHF